MVREQEEQRTDSVFDFLYADQRRIKLYMSQFSDFGNLTSLVHARRVDENTGLSGGIPGVATGEAKQSEHEGIERHYDTQWSEVLNFLDEIQVRQLPRRDIVSTPIGGLFLVSGSLYLVDMRLFSRTWDAVAEGQTPNLRLGRRQGRAQGKSHQSPAAADLSGLKVLGSLDQPVFMILKSGNIRMWSTLEPDFLTGGGSDVNLKQGLHVKGIWHLLGVVDCKPETDDVDFSEVGRLCGGGDNAYSDGVVRIWQEIRLILGRPNDCYGVTPLVIMREIM